jgi:hypothetical protein
MVNGRPVIGPEPKWLPIKEVVANWRQHGFHDVDERLLETVFDKRAPTVDQILDAWSAPQLGLRAELARRSDGTLSAVTISPRTVGFGFVLKDKDGQAITHEVSQRSFARNSSGQLIVYNAAIKVYSDAPKRVAETQLANAVRFYTHLGVEQIELIAAWTGRYAWATFGFDWGDPKERPGIRRSFERYLARNGVPPGTAAQEARWRSEHPWTIADYDYEGKTAPCVFHHVQRGIGIVAEMGRSTLGKAWLLREQNPGWAGVMALTPEAPSFRRFLTRVIRRQIP